MPEDKLTILGVYGKLRDLKKKIKKTRAEILARNNNNVRLNPAGKRVKYRRKRS